MKRFLIPENINYEKLVGLLSYTEYSALADNPKYINACLFFLNLLCKGQGMNREEGSSYNTLSSRLLMQYFSNNSERVLYYKNITQALEQAGIIMINHAFSAESHTSKGYKLSMEYEGRYKYISVKWKKAVDNVIDCPKHHQSIGLLQFNEELYSALVSKLYYSESLYEDVPLFRLRQGDVYVVRDMNGRIHSNLTNVSKIYRGCLQLTGHNLITVDVRNAFQFFLIKPLLEALSDPKGILKEFGGEVPNDVMAYIECVSKGEFLTTIESQMNVTWDWDEYLYDQRHVTKKRKRRKFMEKADFKTALFSKVYFNPLRMHHNPFSKAMDKKFPTVWKFIKEMKIVTHIYLPNLLQRIESEVMDAALNTLYKSHPDGLFIRLHDCIITTETLSGEVQRAISTSCEVIIGYSPKLNVEPLRKHTDEILLRQPTSSVFKVSEQYEFAQMLKKQRRSLNKQYKGDSDGRRLYEIFEWYHHRRFKNIPDAVLVGVN